jgi:two-component system, chemotaxis family, CheB/CheR fusion protein
VTSWNVGAKAILGYTEAEILGKVADLIFAPEDREAGVPEVEAQTALAQGRMARR